MNIARSIALVMSGIVVGIGLVLSCGDNLSAKATADAAIDAPKVLDAAPVCDCPAAEPPLAGRFVVVSNPITLVPNDTGVQGAGCPPGSYLITGSCTTDSSTTAFNVTVRESGFDVSAPTAWHCSFRNNETMYTVTFRASALCLKPAP